MTQNDTLLRFIFKHTPVKGAAVRLTTAWKAMRQYQNWPESVTRLMGEMTAGSLLLASSPCANTKIGPKASRVLWVR